MEISKFRQHRFENTSSLAWDSIMPVQNNTVVGFAEEMRYSVVSTTRTSSQHFRCAHKLAAKSWIYLTCRHVSRLEKGRNNILSSTNPRPGS